MTPDQMSFVTDLMRSIEGWLADSGISLEGMLDMRAAQDKDENYPYMGSLVLSLNGIHLTMDGPANAGISTAANVWELEDE